MSEPPVAPPADDGHLKRKAAVGAVWTVLGVGGGNIVRLLSSQNHGYAVRDAARPPDWELWFVNINDGTNEGVRSRGYPYFSVPLRGRARATPAHFNLWALVAGRRMEAQRPAAGALRGELRKLHRAAVWSWPGGVVIGDYGTTESKRPADRARPWPLVNSSTGATIEQADYEPESLESDAVRKEHVAFARLRPFGHDFLVYHAPNPK